MIAITEHGYHKGKLKANWGCPTCGRIVLTNSTVDDFEAAGIQEGRCRECNKVSKEADRLARYLQYETQLKNISYRNGIYGIRDDLNQHLRGLGTPPQLKSLYRRLAIPLPTLVIPEHQREF